MTATDTTAPPPRILCRAATAADGAGIVDLLGAGFPDRPRAYWEQGIDRLGRHAARMPVPTLGQVIEADGRFVGVLLMIHADDAAGQGGRCNVSSWYVDPAFRGYAALLLTRGSRDRSRTYYNISPATHTRPIIEAQGFRRYGSGRFWSAPWMGRPHRIRVERLTAGEVEARGLPEAERALVADHLDWGCIAVSADAGAGPEPFVFLPRLTKGVVPSAQLVYCRDVARFVAAAGPIGRWLLRRGYPSVAIDADGPVPGLVGLFVTDEVPKYFKGPAAPRLGDMSYSELVMFGP